MKKSASSSSNNHNNINKEKPVPPIPAENNKKSDLPSKIIFEVSDFSITLNILVLTYIYSNRKRNQQNLTTIIIINPIRENLVN